ncbi:MAG TPA: hypothetical protein VNE61_07145 [Ktedonobacteraceae bacterium]|nr:hypothetical protein [Ktedonobacteraceae bacterium]
MSAFNNSNDQRQFTSSSGNTPSDEMLLDAIAGGAVWAMESTAQLTICARCAAAQ